MTWSVFFFFINPSYGFRKKAPDLGITENVQLKLFQSLACSYHLPLKNVSGIGKKTKLLLLLLFMVCSHSTSQYASIG